MPSQIHTRQTVRLTLRQPKKTDRDFTVNLFSRPELVTHRPHPVPDTPEVSKERLNRDIQHWRTYGFGRWAVEHDGRLIGFGGLTHKEGLEGLNISYHLHPDAWGQGYAQEIVADALAVAFGPLGVGRVIGLVRAANPASRRVLEKHGFTFEREVDLDGAPTQVLARGPEGRPPA
jgi:ribosomal-protein-alanine N-acetyltransferase